MPLGFPQILSIMRDIFPFTNFLRNEAAYRAAWAHAQENLEDFWLKQAHILDWERFPSVANQSTFFPTPSIRWFEDGTLNVCFNCLDRHLPHRASQPAIIFEADEPQNTEILTYQQLYDRVNACAHALLQRGVQKGDLVALYLPMVPELIITMLACARLGAVHAVVFSGFSAEALADRLQASNAKLLMTQASSRRGGKTIDLQQNVYEAMARLKSVPDVWFIEKSDFLGCKPAENVPCVPVNAQDALFVLYTSGSAGRPKGVIHGSGGYLTYAALTHRAIFDLQEGDVYFCTADIGWITGHTYGVYGPLANGVSLVLFQGVPTYPTASRFWEIIDQHQVTQFYTAPTALRSLMRFGEASLQKADLRSLRVLASVGEPIDPPTWQWFYEQIGQKRCPIMDTWWQTETGGVLICPLLEGPQKPGCAAKPFPGIQATLVDTQGEITTAQTKGALCLKASWPGQFLGIWHDEAYFQTAYFSVYKEMYTSGDGAQRDESGDFWLLGRLDDVLNVSGHRLNSAELEQAVMQLESVAEACVVGFPHEIKGQGIAVFVVAKQSNENGSRAACALADKHDETNEMTAKVKAVLRQQIGPIATPDRVIIAPDLPKTRSGKLIRRLLRKIASGDAFETPPTLVNPECLSPIQTLWKKKE